MGLIKRSFAVKLCSPEQGGSSNRFRLSERGAEPDFVRVCNSLYKYLR